MAARDAAGPQEPERITASGDPLIVTLRLDEESSLFFDRERERYFPP